MSASANVELVRAIYAAWESGDFSHVEWADLHIEHTAVDGPSLGTSRGIQAMGAAWREVLTDWSDFRAEAEEYRELDDERVLVLHRFSGRGRTSGVEVGPTGAKGACLFYVADGKVTKLLLYSVRARGLADIDLEEYAMSQENIELHERVNEALNTRALSAELAAELAPGFRAENAATAVTDKTYHGAQGLREWVRDIFEGLDEDARYETEEILADGDDFVVARVRIVGHGARSGAPVELRSVNVTWYENGKVTRSVGYLRRREALKAVGLAE